ncbi:hypothetical protein LL668_21095 (plasmid) [Providencia rettgeri]|nr:hypothetical protein LL668_20315 [Providencia rettgeri]UEK61699.1 hypothetical protein LL668_21095 [Providencia rettgeri]
MLLARRIALPRVGHCVNCIERQECSRLR